MGVYMGIRMRIWMGSGMGIGCGGQGGYGLTCWSGSVLGECMCDWCVWGGGGGLRVTAECRSHCSRAHITAPWGVAGRGLTGSHFQGREVRRVLSTTNDMTGEV